MNFDPDLPPMCPPSDAKSNSLENVYRLLASKEPNQDDWLSYKQLGKKGHSEVDECRLSSLSLQKTFPAVQKLKRLPNFRSATHAAVLNIPKESGAHKSKRNHIDFWKAYDVEMGQFVQELKVIEDA